MALPSPTKRVRIPLVLTEQQAGVIAVALYAARRTLDQLGLTDAEQRALNSAVEDYAEALDRAEEA